MPTKLLLLAATSFVLVGCKEMKACTRIQVGDTIGVRLGEAVDFWFPTDDYDLPTCGDAFDVPPDFAKV